MRTVHRDVDALLAAGVPVVTQTGRRGGIRLADGYEVGGLSGIGAEDARALVLAAAPGAAADLGLDIADAVTRSAGERLLIEPEEWFTERDVVPCLPDVARGVWEQRELRLDYLGRSSGSSSPVVRPLGLVLKGRAWYLVARTRRGGDRMFRVARITDVAVLDHTFERPDGFDLGEAWAARTRVHRRRSPATWCPCAWRPRPSRSSLRSRKAHRCFRSPATWSGTSTGGLGSACDSNDRSRPPA